MHIPAQQTNCRNRHGITIIEVLSSIVVAVIGVAGVLVLIPFAVRQAETGLDLESATALAENAIARFEIENFNTVISLNGQDVLPWVIPRSPLQPNVALDSNGNVLDPLAKIDSQMWDVQPPDSLDHLKPVGVYFIDPLWLNSQNDPTESDGVQMDRFWNMFRFVGTDNSLELAFQIGTTTAFGGYGTPPTQPKFVHLIDSSNPFTLQPSTVVGRPPATIPNVMSQAIATRMFVNSDDLEFAFETTQSGAEIDPLGPPQPYLDQLLADVDGDGAIDVVDLRRQYRGELSWSAVAVTRHKTSELDLYNQADIANRVGTRTEGFDFYVLVYKNRSFANPSAYANGLPGLDPDRDPRFLYSTASPTRLDPPPTVAQNPRPTPNEIYGTGTVYLNDPVDIQNDEWIMLVNHDLNGQAHVGFYRVVGSDPKSNGITVDGADFTFQQSLDASGNTTRATTFVIYLRDVVNVYKRQLTIEANSN